MAAGTILRWPAGSAGQGRGHHGAEEETSTKLRVHMQVGHACRLGVHTGWACLQAGIGLNTRLKGRHGWSWVQWPRARSHTLKPILMHCTERGMQSQLIMQGGSCRSAVAHEIARGPRTHGPRHGMVCLLQCVLAGVSSVCVCVCVCACAEGCLACCHPWLPCWHMGRAGPRFQVTRSKAHRLGDSGAVSWASHACNPPLTFMPRPCACGKPIRMGGQPYAPRPCACIRGTGPGVRTSSCPKGMHA
jgi:hypothetical protein